MFSNLKEIMVRFLTFIALLLIWSVAWRAFEELIYGFSQESVIDGIACGVLVFIYCRWLFKE